MKQGGRPPWTPARPVDPARAHAPVPDLSTKRRTDMPTPTKGARLGGSASHQKIILSNLATQLFEHGRIVTTEAKARRLRPLAEKLITKAKRGDIHSRRLVLTTVKDKGVVHTLFTEIAPTLADREGGYTRITKVGPRKGDNAPMALIEIVTESVEESRKANAKAAAAPAKKASPRRAAPAGRHTGRDRPGRGEPRRGTGRRHRGARRAHRVGAGAERRHLRGGGEGVRRRFLPGRRAAGRLRHQGQRGLDEVPHHRVAMV